MERLHGRFVLLFFLENNKEVDYPGEEFLVYKINLILLYFKTERSERREKEYMLLISVSAGRFSRGER